MFKELFESKTDIKRELEQVMQTTAADAQGGGLDVAETAVENFKNIADSKFHKEWDKMSYDQKMKLANNLAKEY